MNKGGIFGEVLEQVGSLAKQTTKQVVKTPLEIVKGTAEQVGVKPQTAAPTETNLKGLKVKEEEEKAKNLAITRQNLAQMMESKKTAEVRPAERVEMKKQQEQQELEMKKIKQPQPLPITAKQGTKEKLVGVSG